MTNKMRITHPMNSAYNWKTLNPVLLKGELGIEAGTLRIKIGDGAHAWNDLPYARSSGCVFAAGPGIIIEDVGGNGDLRILQQSINNAEEVWVDAGTSTYVMGTEAPQTGDTKILNATTVTLEDNGNVVFDLLAPTAYEISTLLRYEVL